MQPVEPVPPWEQSSSVPAAGYYVPVSQAQRARSLRVPAMLVVAGLCVNILLDVADTGLTPFVETALLRGQTASGDDLVVLLGAIASLVQFAAIIGTAAAFIVWLYLARKNIAVWGIQGLHWGPGWAVGGWFIPFANFVIPKLVVDTVWSGSDLGPNDTYATRRSTGFIWSWWLIYLCSGFAAIAYVRHQFRPADDLAFIGGYNATNTIPSIVAAALAIILVRRITDLQERRQAALDQGWRQAVYPTT